MSRTNKFLFISFAGPQAALAKQLCEALRRSKIPCFYSNYNTNVGNNNWVSKIDNKLSDDNCILLPLYSRDYFDEARISYLEFISFVQKYGANAPIYPIKLEKCSEPKPFDIFYWKSIDIKDFNSKVPTLIKDIRALLTRPSDELRSRPNKNIKNELSSILSTEWNKIIERSIADDLSKQSMTQTNIFGWMAASKLLKATASTSRPAPNPLISAYQARKVISKMFHLIIEKKKREYIESICTLRYLLFCFLISSGIKDYDSGFLDAIVKGLSKSSDRAADEQLCLAHELADDLIRNNDKVDLLSKTKQILSAVLGAAQSLTIKLDDIYIEETLPHRAGHRAARMKRIIANNTVTHDVWIYFIDKSGAYFSIADCMLNTIKFNVLRSVSETLVPERLAVVHLKVNYPDRSLLNMIRSVINNNDSVKEIVIDVAVEEGADSSS